MLKKEMKELIQALSQEADSLRVNNETLSLYVKQLQSKLQEVSAVVQQYEKTILVMGFSTINTFIIVCLFYSFSP